MNIVFMGYAVDMNDISNYSGASVAGNKMQTGILRELNKIENVNLFVYTVRPNASFPAEKTTFYNEEKIKICDNLFGVGIKFCNIPVIKQFSQSKEMFKSVNKLLKTLDIKDTVILTFNMFPQIGVPSSKLKKKYGVKLVSLLADLPIDDAAERDPISKLLRKAFDKKTEESIKNADALIVLNKHAIEKFAPGIDYMIMDGGFESSEEENIFYDKSAGPKKILYCGALTKYSGILTLVEAMKYVKSNIVLEVYGKGDISSEIEKAALDNNKVKYLGSLPHEKILKKQKEAYLLINPRPVNDPISMVTFPSKIFEYMYSGTPVISTKLNGFTEEYYDKIFFFENETAECFAKTIDDILSKSYEELCEYANRAHMFIVEERNWEKQTLKIYNYLYNVLYI